MEALPRLAEDKLDELEELFSEHLEGFRAEVTRYGTDLVLFIFYVNMMSQL